jgi:uncharacterized protein involved in response to NO
LDAGMSNGKNHHILNASSNLLGICFFIITALRVTSLGSKTWADEISIVASISFLSACFLSYLSMRIESNSLAIERWADYVFLSGLLLLFVAVTAFYAGF